MEPYFGFHAIRRVCFKGPTHTNDARNVVNDQGFTCDVSCFGTYCD
jgi:hypothetical protein